MSEISKQKARNRNLLVMMVKIIATENLDINRTFSSEEIHDIFYFRQSDLLYSIKEFFIEENDELYLMKNDLKEKISQYRNNYMDAKINNDENIEKFNQCFGKFKEKVERQGWKNWIEEYPKMFNSISDILNELHWASLPVYSEQMIMNRKIIPEDNLVDYYDHYHALEDLYDVINSKENYKMSYKGDINLDYKMIFSVFTRRWGHYDNYSITRVVDGWEISHLSYRGRANKDGGDVLYQILDHDFVQYPKEGVRFAFKTLWNMADEEEMSVEELKVKLQEIADWISQVEKTVGSAEPNWCGYYS